MRRFMDQTDQILGRRLAGQNGNLSAVADAKSGRDVLVVFKGDVLRVKKGNQTVAVFAHFAGDVVLKLGQVCTFGLRHILSRDLRPARLANMLHRVAGMDASIAVHGFLDCYDDLPCEAKFG